VESASRNIGPLIAASLGKNEYSGQFLDWPVVDQPTAASPLKAMTQHERVFADFHGTGLTVGPHPLAQHRPQLNQRGITPASQLKSLPDGQPVSVVGAVIVRQRPGTAKGFVFLSLEDETGVSNIIITPQLFEQDHRVVVHHSFLHIRGTLQNQDGVISVKAQHIEPFHLATAEVESHDFH
jgi:error-prone DNA polymerase